MYGKSEVLVNQVLLDRILQIKQQKFLNGDSYEEWKEELIEKIKITRLAEMIESFNEEEIAALVLVGVEKYPETVFQIVLGEYLVNKERKQDKNENRKNV